MRCAMVDYFALAVSHGLLALAAWRLMLRADLNADSPGDDGEAKAESDAEQVHRA
jgi:hypothetical protein